jgi:hypothetical protein
LPLLGAVEGGSGGQSREVWAEGRSGLSVFGCGWSAGDPSAKVRMPFWWRQADHVPPLELASVACGPEVSRAELEKMARPVLEETTPSKVMRVEYENVTDPLTGNQSRKRIVSYYHMPQSQSDRPTVSEMGQKLNPIRYSVPSVGLSLLEGDRSSDKL